MIFIGNRLKMTTLHDIGIKGLKQGQHDTAHSMSTRTYSSNSFTAIMFTAKLLRHIKRWEKDGPTENVLITTRKRDDNRRIQSGNESPMTTLTYKTSYITVEKLGSIFIPWGVPSLHMSLFQHMIDILSCTYVINIITLNT